MLQMQVSVRCVSVGLVAGSSLRECGIRNAVVISGRHFGPIPNKVLSNTYYVLRLDTRTARRHRCDSFTHNLLICDQFHPIHLSSANVFEDISTYFG
jgi:hypothetical protein